MDARETRAVKLGGKEMTLYVPTPEQGLALAMVQEAGASPEEMFSVVTALWLDLFQTPEDRTYFLTQMAVRKVGLKDLTDGLVAVLGVDPAEVAKGAKKTAKKTVAKAP